MKINTFLFSHFSRKFAIVFLMASLNAIGCSAYPGNSGACENQVALQDSAVRKVVGDSIYSIINDAQKVKVKLANDSCVKDCEITLKRKYKPVVQFILSDPQIYAGDIPVYGTLMPSLTLTFIKKKACCLAHFDFGLKKWAICDYTGKELERFDLTSNDMLRFAKILFPNSKYLQSLNTERK